MKNILKAGLDPEHFFHGVVRLQRESDCFNPTRFTARQVRYYESQSDVLAIRVYCQAGQTIEFVTDSSSVAISGTVGVGARDYFSLDVQIGEYMHHPVLVQPAPQGDVSFVLWRLRDGEERRMRSFRIHLPHVRKFAVRAVDVDEDAVVEPVQPRGRRLLCLGDSITQGMEARHPSNAYPMLLARWIDAELLNLGVGGDVFDVAAVDSELPFQPDLVTIAFGVNDWNRGLDAGATGLNVDRYVRTVREIYSHPPVPIVVISPIWAASWAERRAGGNLAEFGRAIRDAAAGIEGVEVIDGFSLVPHDPRCFVDGLHPNDEGSALYAGSLLPFVGRMT